MASELDWRQWAVCKDADPRVFDPSINRSGEAQDRAAAYCRNCQVWRACLMEALTTARAQETGMIWGGVWFRTDGEQRVIV